MDTHRDSDFPQDAQFTEALTPEQMANLEALKSKAGEMTARLESVITAGLPGEPVLLEAIVNGVLIRRMPDDPLHVLRVSLGEASKLPDSTYLVFRGDPFQATTLLRRALKAMEQRF